jgi:hypothetical protein
MDDKLKKQKIWQIANKIRLQPVNMTMLAITEALAEEELEIDLEVLRFISTSFCARQLSCVTPKDVAEFIAEIVSQFSPKKIIDPCANLGCLALPLHKSVKPECLDAYSLNVEQKQIWDFLQGPKEINFRIGDGLVALSSEHSQFDAVVSFPPFGMRTNLSVELELDGKKTIFKGEYAHLLILESCKHLSAGGLGVFIVSDSFLFASSAKRIKEAMAKLGFAMTIAIELPAGTFAPLTNISSHIVVIEKNEHDRVFTGRFSSSEESRKGLLENIKKRKKGSNQGEGLSVPRQSFRGFSSIDLTEQLERMAEIQEFVPKPFSSVVIELNTPGPAKDVNGFQHIENSVYLPQMGSTPATTDQADLPEKLKSYFQLIIDPKVADAEFIAGLLNTPFGKIWRDTLRTSVTIPRISVEHLRGSSIYLPRVGRKLQTELVKFQNKLSFLRTQVNEFESRLWSKPSSVVSLKESVIKIYSNDRYEDWLETLPFPLASILWVCHIQEGSSKRRYEIKIQFFEALAEFLGVLHLSAYKSEPNVWESVQEDMNDALKNGGVSLRMASFGTWVNLLGFFSKKSRSQLNLADEEEKEAIYELYKTRNQNFLNKLFSRKIVSIVMEVNKIRNDWLGHTGIVSETDASRINEDLDRKIQEIRRIFGISWNDYQLWLPGNSKYSGASHEYRAKKIMGTRTPFATESVCVIKPMEDGHLYFKDPSEARGLKLLPLIKILPSPKTQENACYFYNRRGKNGIRFLSYYFEGDSKVTDEFGDVASVIENLEPDISDS